MWGGKEPRQESGIWKLEQQSPSVGVVLYGMAFGLGLADVMESYQPQHGFIDLKKTIPKNRLEAIVPKISASRCLLQDLRFKISAPRSPSQISICRYVVVWDLVQTENQTVHSWELRAVAMIEAPDPPTSKYWKLLISLPMRTRLEKLCLQRKNGQVQHARSTISQ